MPAQPADVHDIYAQAALHLGRAFLLADQPDPALDHLHAALDHALPGGLQPHLPLLITEAERYAALGDQREAIQRWQDIAPLLGEATPESIDHPRRPPPRRLREMGALPAGTLWWRLRHPHPQRLARRHRHPTVAVVVQVYHEVIGSLRPRYGDAICKPFSAAGIGAAAPTTGSPGLVNPAGRFATASDFVHHQLRR
jgi:hypothetical protein